MLNKSTRNIFIIFVGFYFFKEDIFYFCSRYFISPPLVSHHVNISHFSSLSSKIITQLYGDYLIINRTSLPINTAVLGKEGLVGKIIAHTKYTQKIQLITNRNSKIPVYIKEFGKAILKGDGHGRLKLEYIYPFSKSIWPKKGNFVYTLGIDGIFPKHIPVAVVINVKNSKNIICKPYENIDMLSEVVCVRRSS